MAALQGTAQGGKRCRLEEVGAELQSAAGEQNIQGGLQPSITLKQRPADGVRAGKIYRGDYSRAEAANAANDTNGNGIVGSTTGLVAGITGASPCTTPLHFFCCLYSVARTAIISPFYLLSDWVPLQCGRTQCLGKDSMFGEGSRNLLSGRQSDETFWKSAS